MLELFLTYVSMIIMLVMLELLPMSNRIILPYNENSFDFLILIIHVYLKKLFKEPEICLKSYPLDKITFKILCPSFEISFHVVLYLVLYNICT